MYLGIIVIILFLCVFFCIFMVSVFWFVWYLVSVSCIGVVIEFGGVVLLVVVILNESVERGLVDCLFGILFCNVFLVWRMFWLLIEKKVFFLVDNLYFKEVLLLRLYVFIWVILLFLWIFVFFLYFIKLLGEFFKLMKNGLLLLMFLMLMVIFIFVVWFLMFWVFISSWYWEDFLWFNICVVIKLFEKGLILIMLFLFFDSIWYLMYFVVVVEIDRNVCFLGIFFLILKFSEGFGYFGGLLGGKIFISIWVLFFLFWLFLL